MQQKYLMKNLKNPLEKNYKKGVSMYNRIILSLVVLIAVIFTGCSRSEEKARNFEQIYDNKGIPVKVKEIKSEIFTRNLTYNATLKGNEESIASAKVGGKIEKVHIEIGDEVEKDQVIMEFPEDIPGANYRQAKSGYELAKKSFERLQNLYKIGGISKQKLDSAETQLEVSKANWDAAQQLLKIRAPIAGTVIDIYVNETDNVKAKTALAIISRSDKMKAKIWATEAEICQIKKGMKATAFWNGNELNGRVTKVPLAKNQMNNAFGVDLVFDNSKKICKSGVVSKIKITVYENKEAIVVPRKYVRNDSKGQFVYIAKENRSKKRYLEIGNSNGNFEIIGGLEIGQKLITEGSNYIKNDSKIAID